MQAGTVKRQQSRRLTRRFGHRASLSATRTGVESSERWRLECSFPRGEDLGRFREFHRSLLAWRMLDLDLRWGEGRHLDC